jgi:hypothetical protein
MGKITREIQMVAALPPKRTGGNPAAGAHNAAKTHCPRGHAYAGDNLAVYAHRDGGRQRQCRACGIMRRWEEDQTRGRVGAADVIAAVEAVVGVVLTDSQKALVAQQLVIRNRPEAAS